LPAPSRRLEEGAHKNLCNRVDSPESWPNTPSTQPDGQRASDNEDYPRGGVPQRSDDQGQSQQEERPGQRRSGRRDKRHAYGYHNMDDEGGDIHQCRECGLSDT